MYSLMNINISWNNYKNIQKKELTFCRDNENIKLINYKIIVLKSQFKSKILTKYKNEIIY